MTTVTSATVSSGRTEDAEVGVCETMVTIGSRTIPRLNWTLSRPRGEHHDNRRLVSHRVKNCQCEVCYREINKLPPAEPLREIYATKKRKLEEREIKKVKRITKKNVKDGKQACIRNFFRY
jgi:DNA recombination-dependent growth factor C